MRARYGIALLVHGSRRTHPGLIFFHFTVREMASATSLVDDAPAVLYRGVLSHKRWLPAAHGFVYELFMMLLDVDVRIAPWRLGIWRCRRPRSSNVCCT